MGIGNFLGDLGNGIKHGLDKTVEGLNVVDRYINPFHTEQTITPGGEAAADGVGEDTHDDRRDDAEGDDNPQAAGHDGTRPRRTKNAAAMAAEEVKRTARMNCSVAAPEGTNFIGILLRSGVHR